MRIRTMAILCTLLGMGLSVGGCATTRGISSASSDTAPSEPPSSNPDELTILRKRVEALDTQVSELSHQLETTQIALRSALGVEKPQAVAVPEDQTEGLGVKPTATPSAKDPAGGWASTDGTSSFREARALFDAQKYPEALLAFTAFLKNHGDHFLADAAQFCVGESYFKRGEWQLSREELERLLIAYDRSSYLPQALLRLSMIHEKLHEPEKARDYRKMLLAYFPTSPAAAEIQKESTSEVTESASQPKAPEPQAQGIRNLPHEAGLDQLPFQTAPVPAYRVGDRQ